MASVHKRNGKWQVRWRQGSSNRSRTFNTKEEARIWQGMMERSEVAPLRADEVPTLAEYCDRWLARRNDLADSTRVQYRRWLTYHVYPPLWRGGQELGMMKLHEFDSQVMVRWQDARLDDDAGPAVLGKTQTLLSQIFDRAVLEGYLPHNPLASMKRPGYKKKKARFLSATQVESLRSWYLDHDDLGSATLISVLAYIGIRPQDALALEWNDLDADLYVGKKNIGGEIVPGDKTGDGHERWVKVHPTVRADLMTWREAIPNERLIFPNQNGQPWTAANYNNWRSRKQEKDGQPAKIKCFKRAALDCGLGWELKPYDLRHTAATLYAAAGWNHLEIARQLGHTPEVSVRVYQHLLDRHIGQDRRSIDNMISEAREHSVPRSFPKSPMIGS
jgi:integrase